MASLALLTLRSSSSSLRSIPLRSYSAANASLTSRPLRIFQHRRRGFALKSDEGTQKAGETTSDENSSQPSSSSSSNNPSKSSDVPPPPTPRMRQAFASLDFEPHEKPDGMSESPSLITDGSTSSTGDARRMRTGAKSAKNSMSSIERKKRRMAWAGTIGFVGILLGSWLYNGWDEDPNAEPGIKAWISRSNKNTLKMVDLFDKPAWEQILPDKLPEQSPYTLVISLDDLLVSGIWDRQNGWRTAKRPGVDYFLGYLSQFYEIVIFTTQAQYTALPIVDQFDPYQFYTTYQIFREATRTYKGHIIKDLSYLNRDLSKVVAIDTVAERYELQPDNAIIASKWKPGTPGVGDHADGDAGLVGLIPFLESLVIYRVPDVRTVVKEYRDKDVPKEYAKIEALNKERLLKEWEVKQKKGVTLGRITGSSSTPPRTRLEEERAIAQLMYKQQQEELERQKPELDRLKKEGMEAQMKAMMEGGMIGMLSQQFGLAPRPDVSQQLASTNTTPAASTVPPASSK